MSETTLKIEHVRFAVKELRAIEKRAADVAAMLEARLEGSATAGEQMKRITDAFVELWARRYRTKYVFAGGKDATAVKRLLAVLDVDEILKRVPRYIANDDPFYVKVRHSLTMFASTINQHGPTSDQGGHAAGAIDCKHTPPCQSDVEHTRRVNAELRA